MARLSKATHSRDQVHACGTQQYRALRRFVLVKVGNEQDARELVQEAYLRLLRASQARVIEDPAAYLFRIAQNLLYEWYKSAPPPSEPLDEELLAGDTPDVESSVELAQQLDRLGDALAQLPPNCASAVIMHRRDGMTYQEIAQALGVSAAMVKKYLARGLAQCRSALRNHIEF